MSEATGSRRGGGRPTLRLGPDDVVDHLRRTSTRDQMLVGLCGPPGVGKSTAAAWLAHRLDGVVVPMDGFHLARSVLVAHGTIDRIGAPHTFDAAGFAAALHRIRSRPIDQPVYLPDFDRAIGDPTAGAIEVSSEPFVVVDGNYLLLPDHHWTHARSALDVVVFVDLDRRRRLRRLVRRHVDTGRTRHDAIEFVRSSDEPNAQLIVSHREQADLLMDVSGHDLR